MHDINIYRFIYSINKLCLCINVCMICVYVCVEYGVMQDDSYNFELFVNNFRIIDSLKRDFSVFHKTIKMSSNDHCSFKETNPKICPKNENS